MNDNGQTLYRGQCLSMPVPGTVDLFLFTGAEAIAPPLAAALAVFLAPEETRRVHALQRCDDQCRTLAARGMLRRVLSDYHPQIAPGVWQFTHNAYGKPALTVPLLQFNVSHTEGMIALAFSHADCAVGVDVELQGKLSAQQSRELYDLVLAPQERRHVEHYEREFPGEAASAFLRTWALKEAWLKATGAGLSISPAHIALCFNVDQQPALQLGKGIAASIPEHQQLTQLVARNWWLHHQQLRGDGEQGHELAVALDVGQHVGRVGQVCVADLRRSDWYFAETY
ncbi:4'-phosphopantetheinyl transferase family protein [Herbaspirillum rubrisubalbicans]|uniref:4'-phosphopantetheinyl transferase domain-containing protein n=1 Tax=Herbaspirillum rubrisubalbicans TaxID=80842 RepID=A0AAD0UCR8_9BURK|nr:4'-phosphopantetheinyl transferase superfamily protein [Herbaspirillum rubrisubalbicans]AYR24504.1 hypothetical protein RC54_11960 [Herbaspirillum rubrisubalbicans]